MNKILISTLFTATLASAIPAAIAPMATPQTNGPQRSHARQDQHAKRPFQLPSERVEARLAYIQTALKITDTKSQWGKLRRYICASKRGKPINAFRSGEPRWRSAQRRQLSTIERLERRQCIMTAGAQRLNELIAAGKPLYATLSPDQKQIAYGLLSPGHGRGGHGRHHGTHRNA